MRIRTNTGIVELTAEMVTKGMVFAPKNPRDYIMGEGRVFVVGTRDVANGIWRDARNDSLGTNVLGADRLLGCDPAIATRADCERYGVHGDAVAHGFAKLRDGGALDLRRKAPVGSVCYDADGRRFIVYDGPIPPYACFLGLNSHVRKEDVDRLCCGALKEDTTESVRTRCTLAIGGHDMHEDLSTGVRWPAAVVRISGFGEIRTFTLNSAPTLIQQLSRKPYDPAPILAMQRLANGTGDARVAPRIPCPECHAETTCPNGTYHHDHCPVTRRAREAPIVALVNAVPEGLDAIGWRAAVLAAREYWQRHKVLPNWPNAIEAISFTMFVSRSILGTFTPDPTSCVGTSLVAYRRAIVAYRRAITPSSKATPVRKQKTLSIRLPDDDDIGW